MSAFVLDKDHIDLLVSLAMTGPSMGHTRTTWRNYTWWTVGDNPVRRTATPEAADDIGKMLLRANVVSICARYSQDDVESYAADVAGYRFSLTPPVSPVHALKALQCFVYQCDGIATWETSEARNFCESLTSDLIQTLPGYDDAAWAYQRPDRKPVGEILFIRVGGPA